MAQSSKSHPLNMLRKALAPRGHLDALTSRRVGGWALASGGVEVEVWLDDTRVAHGTPSIQRDDVAAALPKEAGALTSGFAFDLPDGAFRDDFVGELRVIAKPHRWWLPSTTLSKSRMVGKSVLSAMNDAPESGILGPFPKGVINAIASRWPEDCADLRSVGGQRRFAARLIEIWSTPELNSIPEFADYARYLSSTLAHCRFVERCFPQTNERASPGAADFHCKPNSIWELFTIINQIYVLKSWGIEGDFAEFGCFKGYSSAMLSYACSQLGLRMHIFDSFEGLPPSEGSGYEAGQYAGSLDEVRDHVRRFGAIDAVEFHKGFFADTLRDWRPPRLMCLWMDVDLEVSSQDLMVAADCLAPEASLFSHECTADIFRDGTIISERNRDNPIPPMIERHEALGRPLTGQYVAGFTGAFWPREGGIPVIDNHVLRDLARAITNI